MEANENAVYIVSIGANTAIGKTAPSSAAAVRAGIAGFAEHRAIADTFGNPVVVASAQYIAGNKRGIERFLDLGCAAATEALNVRADEPIPVIIGIPEGRPGISESFTADLIERFGTSMGASFRISSIDGVFTGHSGGIAALAKGRDKIGRGECEVCLIGGIDSYLDPEMLKWLEHRGQLHGAGEVGNEWGFIPGEAAGFCLLASRRFTQKHSLPLFGEVVAVATAEETHLINTDTTCTGEGLTRAISEVLNALSAPVIKIDYTICDMNGEPYRADEFGYAMSRLNGYFTDASDFLTPADCWGDVGAASGPLFAILAVESWRRGYAKGPYQLAWTSSEGGQRGAMVLKSMMEDNTVDNR